MRSRLILRLTVAAALISVVGVVVSSAEGIVGGNTIAIASSPTTVYVEYEVGSNSYYHCTGSIIDATHVVTAAHCLYDLDNGNTPAQPSQLMVDAGLSNFFTPTSTDTAQSVKVSSFRIHPGYAVGSDGDADDVAVLALASPLDLSSPGVSAVTLPGAATTIPGGTSVTIAGFGRQNASSPAGGPLASMTATTYPKGACGAYTKSDAIVNDDAIEACLASPTSSVCSGDSGAGVLASGSVLVGIVTNGTLGCPAGGAAIFAAVSAPEILAFIQGSDKPPTAPRPSRTTFYRLRWPQPLTVGASLTCSTGGWSSPVQLSYAFLDARTKAVLQSGSRFTYLLPSKASEMTIGCRITVSNGGGVAVVSTISTSKIKPAPPRPKR